MLGHTGDGVANARAVPRRYHQVIVGQDEVGPWTARFITYFPIASVVLFLLAVPHPRTRALAYWIVMENKPVELATFMFLSAGGIIGLWVVLQGVRQREPLFVVAFYALFTAGVIFSAGEEVAWGQWFLHYRTPAWFEQVNAQHEVTFHNVRWLQGHSDFFRLAFGLGGVIGLLLDRWPAFRKIAVPRLLGAAVLTIASVSIVDTYEDFYPMQRTVSRAIFESSEVIEMLIGFAALTYVWLNLRKLAAGWRA